MAVVSLETRSLPGAPTPLVRGARTLRSMRSWPMQNCSSAAHGLILRIVCCRRGRPLRHSVRMIRRSEGSSAQTTRTVRPVQQSGTASRPFNVLSTASHGKLGLVSTGRHLRSQCTLAYRLRRSVPSAVTEPEVRTHVRCRAPNLRKSFSRATVIFHDRQKSLWRAGTWQERLPTN